jgi:hypothetical protein
MLQLLFYMILIYDVCNTNKNIKNGFNMIKRYIVSFMMVFSSFSTIADVNTLSHIEINSIEDVCGDSSALFDDNPNTVYECNLDYMEVYFRLSGIPSSSDINRITFSFSSDMDPIDDLYVDFDDDDGSSIPVIYENRPTIIDNHLTYNLNMENLNNYGVFLADLYTISGISHVKDIILHKDTDDISHLLSPSSEPDNNLPNDNEPDNNNPDNNNPDSNEPDSNEPDNNPDSNEGSGSTVLPITLQYTAFKLPINITNPVAAAAAAEAAAIAAATIDDCSDGSINQVVVDKLNDDFSGSPYNGDSNYWCSLNMINGNGGNTVILSSSIESLTNLWFLSLSNNAITSIPEEVCTLTNLTQINFSGNQLTSMPSCIGDLIDLTYINLTNNNLTTLPSTIGNLKKVTQLLASNNLNFSSIPVEIGNMDAMQYLYFDYSNLTTIPIEVVNLVNLNTLNVSDSNLQSVPVAISNLAISWLNVSNNPDLVFE